MAEARSNPKEFIAPKWRQVLADHGLADFNALWHFELDPLDVPNTGRDRGSWSTVGCLSLELPDGLQKKLIVKRQQRYSSRTLRHPFRGVPTFEKEYHNILHYQRLGIPTIAPVYYAWRNSPDGVQAVLITEYLDGHKSLKELEETWKEYGWPKRAERKRLIKAVAAVIRKLHSKGLQHNCLYTKHLFIQQRSDEIRVRFIDLERTKQRPFGNGRRIRDLESLNRRAKEWSRTDRLRFFLTYCDIKRLDKDTKRLCRQIIRQSKRKTLNRQDKR